MNKLILLFLLCGVAAFAQCPSQSLSPSSPQINCVSQNFYDGSGNLVNTCEASAIQPVTTFYVSSGTLVSIAVAANVGTITFSSTSFLWQGAQIAIAGSTTSALNGTYKIQSVSGSTATINTTGVANGTYNNAAMTLSTTQPLLNAPVWAIAVNVYNGTNQLTGSYWAGTPSSTVNHGLACSNRGNY